MATSDAGTVLFAMDMELEEDVDAYLEDFNLYCGLGSVREAQEIAEKVLWKHIDLFPVFAELAAFYINNHDRRAILELIAELVIRDVTFHDNNEREFLKMTALYAKEDLVSSSTAALSSKKSPDEQKTHDSHGRMVDLNHPFFQCKLASVCVAHNIEVQLSVLLNAVSRSSSETSEYENIIVDFAWCIHDDLLSLGKLREAAEILLSYSFYVQQRRKEVQFPLILQSLEAFQKMQLRNVAKFDSPESVVAAALSSIRYGMAVVIILDYASNGVSQDPDLNQKKTGILAEMQESLNTISELRPDVEQGGIITDFLSHQEQAASGQVALLSPQPEADLLNETGVEGPLTTLDFGDDSKTSNQSTSQQSVIHRSFKTMGLFNPGGEILIYEPTNQIFMERSQHDVFLLEPQTNTHVTNSASGSRTYVECSEGQVYVDRAGNAVHITNSQGRVSLYNARDAVNITNSQGRVSLYDARDTVKIANSQGRVFIDDARDTVRITDPKEQIFLDNARNTVNMRNPEGQIYLFKPQNDVYVSNSHSPIHLIEANNEIHLYDSKATIYLHGANNVMHVAPTDTSTGDADVKLSWPAFDPAPYRRETRTSTVAERSVSSAVAERSVSSETKTKKKAVESAITLRVVEARKNQFREVLKRVLPQPEAVIRDFSTPVRPGPEVIVT